MSKQYCFNINNPNNIEIDINQLKKFVENIYIGRKNEQFNKNENIPFTTIYVRSDKSICILMTSSGKKNIERIEKINAKINKKKLKWKNNITLSEPYEFDVKTEAWWEEKIISNSMNCRRWTSLVQKGPYFKDIMDPYVPLKASLIYEGKKYLLNPREEKIASFYAKRKISESLGNVVDNWTKDKIFNQNFWKDFKKYLSPEHKIIFKKFSKIDWSDIILKINKAKDVVVTKEEKIYKKALNEEKKREYGYALLDGKKEKIGNFVIEPQSIFYGRGQNPNRGKVKLQIFPEDVTINIGINDPIPEPPPGHNWGNIVNDYESVWLARWNDSITGDIKYIMFSAEGRFKGEADLVKYEKARKLEKHINFVREKYMKDALSVNNIKMQLGTVLYLIDHFGVRVGNEKKSEEADTVGASTLRVGHVKLKSPNHVIFDFLGKDSIRFYKDLTVPKLIYNNFYRLIEDKNDSEQLFDLISSRNINAYLKEFDKCFSAKVFRTRLASKIMYENLKNVNISKKDTKSRIKILFNKANIEVAKVLNHTRNVSKKAKESVKKYKKTMKELKIKLKEYKKQGKKHKTLTKRIKTLKNRIEAKTDVMAVAINTSLTNYIDPRIIVAWSKQQNVDLTAIYTSVLMRKFNWAIETTNKSWDWNESLLIGNPNMEPLEENNMTENSLKDNSDSVYNNFPTIGPGDIENYKLLLKICKDPNNLKNKLMYVPKNVLEWIYPFSKYALEKGIINKINKYIVGFYEKAYK